MLHQKAKQKQQQENRCITFVYLKASVQNEIYFEEQKHI